jgi:hypothetical protein
MGWSGGSEVAYRVWDAVKEYIPDNKKKEVANSIIDTLEDQDWDCLEEAEELYEISGRKAEDDEMYGEDR